MDAHLGLPETVINLIGTENVHFGQNLTWKVVSNNSFTQLTLIWDKPNSIYSTHSQPIYHDQYVNNRYNGHGYGPGPRDRGHMHHDQNINNNGHGYYPPGLYRRKTPSELRRSQRRKMQYMQKCLQRENQHAIPAGEAAKASAPTQCSTGSDSDTADGNITGCPKSSCSEVKVTPKKRTVAKTIPQVTVKTRSMAKTDHNCDTVENARDNILVSPMKVLSPESVHNSIHQESDTDSLLSSSDSECSQSESEPDEADPILPPGCFNTKCSYGGGRGRRETDVRLYECTKCGTGICQECFDEGTAHSGHRKYIKFKE